MANESRLGAFVAQAATMAPSPSRTQEMNEDAAGNVDSAAAALVRFASASSQEGSMGSRKEAGDVAVADLSRARRNALPTGPSVFNAPAELAADADQGSTSRDGRVSRAPGRPVQDNVGAPSIDVSPVGGLSLREQVQAMAHNTREAAKGNLMPLSYNLAVHLDTDGQGRLAPPSTESATPEMSSKYVEHLISQGLAHEHFDEDHVRRFAQQHRELSEAISAQKLSPEEAVNKLQSATNTSISKKLLRAMFPESREGTSGVRLNQAQWLLTPPHKDSLMSGLALHRVAAMSQIIQGLTGRSPISLGGATRLHMGQPSEHAAEAIGRVPGVSQADIRHDVRIDPGDALSWRKRVRQIQWGLNNAMGVPVLTSGFHGVRPTGEGDSLGVDIAGKRYSADGRGFVPVGAPPKKRGKPNQDDTVSFGDTGMMVFSSQVASRNASAQEKLLNRHRNR